MDERDLIHVAAIIVAIRTAKLPPTEFFGMATPKVSAEIAAGLEIARKIGARAEREREQRLHAQQVDAERDARLAADPK